MSQRGGPGINKEVIAIQTAEDVAGGKRRCAGATTALLMTEKNFRRIMDYRDWQMLKADLGRNQSAS